MTDRYLDTAARGGRLAAAGHRARLRRTGHDVELTLKHEIATAGSVSERLELSGPATASRDPGNWPPSNARSRLGDIVGREVLVEIAVVRQQRLTRVLRRGGTEVEVSLDRVEALDGQRVVARRWEIEAELIAEDAGARVALEELAAALRSVSGVGDAGGPKLEFGRLHREA